MGSSSPVSTVVGLDVAASQQQQQHAPPPPPPPCAPRAAMASNAGSAPFAPVTVPPCAPLRLDAPSSVNVPPTTSASFSAGAPSTATTTAPLHASLHATPPSSPAAPPCTPSVAVSANTPSAAAVRAHHASMLHPPIALPRSGHHFSHVGSAVAHAPGSISSSSALLGAGLAPPLSLPVYASAVGSGSSVAASSAASSVAAAAAAAAAASRLPARLNGCARCGRTLAAGSRRCRHCREPVRSSSAGTAAAVAAAAAVVVAAAAKSSSMHVRTYNPGGDVLPTSRSRALQRRRKPSHASAGSAAASGVAAAVGAGPAGAMIAAGPGRPPGSALQTPAKRVLPNGATLHTGPGFGSSLPVASALVTAAMHASSGGGGVVPPLLPRSETALAPAAPASPPSQPSGAPAQRGQDVVVLASSPDAAVSRVDPNVALVKLHAEGHLYTHAVSRARAPPPPAVCGGGSPAGGDAPLSLLDSFTPAQVAVHVRALQAETLQRRLRPLIQRLMDHPLNGGLFNAPVQPAELNLTDYFDVIKQPMDLGTVRQRVEGGKYVDDDAVLADVTLVFQNACTYNPRGHAVHTAAEKLLSEFTSEFKKLTAKSAVDSKRKDMHSCGFCQGQVCRLCGDKCLRFDPPILTCDCCMEKIKRGDIYYRAPTGQRWCVRCVSNGGMNAEPGAVLPPAALLHYLRSSAPGSAIMNLQALLKAAGVDWKVVVAAASAAGLDLPLLASAAGTDAASGEAPAGEAVPTATPAGGDAAFTCSAGAAPKLVLRRRRRASECDATAGAGAGELMLQAGGSGAPGASGVPVPSAALAPACAPSPTPSPALPHEASQLAARAAAAGSGLITLLSGPSGAALRGHLSALGIDARAIEVTAAAVTVALTSSLPSAPSEVVAARKAAMTTLSAALRTRLEKRRNDEVVAEPWVQCDKCGGWVHQVCALFNARKNALLTFNAPYVCTSCRPSAQAPPPGSADAHADSASSDACDSVSRAAPTATTTASVGAASAGEDGISSDGGATTTEAAAAAAGGGGTPAPTAADAASDSASADPFATASTLPHTPLSEEIERRVRERMRQFAGDEAAASLSVRMVSSLRKMVTVPEHVRTLFTAAQPDLGTVLRTLASDDVMSATASESVATQSSWTAPRAAAATCEPPTDAAYGGRAIASHYAAMYPYRQRVLLLWQKLDGVDVCLFALYLQEYGADCPAPNTRSVYIAYLDSVRYLRPLTARTAIYHELLAAYLANARARGYRSAYIWACPPQRGDAYIFHCHPPNQRVPGKERLREWYDDMLRQLAEEGVVSGVRSLFDEFFEVVSGRAGGGGNTSGGGSSSSGSGSGSSAQLPCASPTLGDRRCPSSSASVFSTASSAYATTTDCEGDASLEAARCSGRTPRPVCMLPTPPTSPDVATLLSVGGTKRRASSSATPDAPTPCAPSSPSMPSLALADAAAGSASPTADGPAQRTRSAKRQRRDASADASSSGGDGVTGAACSASAVAPLAPIPEGMPLAAALLPTGLDDLLACRRRARGAVAAAAPAAQPASAATTPRGSPEHVAAAEPQPSAVLPLMVTPADGSGAAPKKSNGSAPHAQAQPGSARSHRSRDKDGSHRRSNSGSNFSSSGGGGAASTPDTVRMRPGAGLPPYFVGDFWAMEMERMLRDVHKRLDTRAATFATSKAASAKAQAAAAAAAAVATPAKLAVPVLGLASSGVGVPSESPVATPAASATPLATVGGTLFTPVRDAPPRAVLTRSSARRVSNALLFGDADGGKMEVEDAMPLPSLPPLLLATPSISQLSTLSASASEEGDASMGTSSLSQYFPAPSPLPFSGATGAAGAPGTSSVPTSCRTPAPPVIVPPDVLEALPRPVADLLSATNIVVSSTGMSYRVGELLLPTHPVHTLAYRLRDMRREFIVVHLAPTAQEARAGRAASMRTAGSVHSLSTVSMEAGLASPQDEAEAHELGDAAELLCGGGGRSGDGGGGGGSIGNAPASGAMDAGDTKPAKYVTSERRGGGKHVSIALEEEECDSTMTGSSSGCSTAGEECAASATAAAAAAESAALMRCARATEVADAELDEQISCDFFDTRHGFLRMCQGNNYQADTLRRAKHSSMMVLWHLHNPSIPAYAHTCNVCEADIGCNTRWHCETCYDFDVCVECAASVEHQHALVRLAGHEDTPRALPEREQARAARPSLLADVKPKQGGGDDSVGGVCGAGSSTQSLPTPLPALIPVGDS